jgi:hypothetical protein
MRSARRAWKIAVSHASKKTDESIHGQEVTFYLVPGTADFNQMRIRAR